MTAALRTRLTMECTNSRDESRVSSSPGFMAFFCIARDGREPLTGLQNAFTEYGVQRALFMPCTSAKELDNVKSIMHPTNRGVGLAGLLP